MIQASADSDRAVARPTATSTQRLPDFIIIGAAKSGTTTLYTYLARHPDVFMSTPKEPCYFSNDEHYAKGHQSYYDLFQGAREDQLCGEASTDYTKWPKYPNSAERMHQLCPDVKLIYIMRHPVEREYSWYGHLMRGSDTMTFEQARAMDPGVFNHCGNYIRQIQEFLRYYPRERFLFLILDDLEKDPAGVMEQVQRFLGLPVKDLSDGEDKTIANKGGGRAHARKKLNEDLESLKKIPLVRPVGRLFPKSLHKKAYKWLLESSWGKRYMRERSNQLTPLSPKLRAELLEIFREPTKELERFLGRELPDWYR